MWSTSGQGSTAASPSGRTAKQQGRPARPQRGRRMEAASWLWGGFGGGGGSSDKVIHMVRHGETEMNVHLGLCSPGYGEPGFVDPMLHDTVLTRNGRAQAAKAAGLVARLNPAPEVVVVSPLTRALQTADIAFHGLPWPRLVNPLAAERLYLSSDVGRLRAELESEFPHYNFEHLLGGRSRAATWWHTGWGSPWDRWGSSSDTSGSWEASSLGASSSSGEASGGQSEWEAELSDEELLAVAEEPEEVFLRRVERLRQWLASRPERSIALVSHWGVLQALTNRDFYNCEVRTMPLGRLRARPHLLGAAQVVAAGRVAL